MKRILMTGSRDWTDAQVSADALNATLALLGVSAAEAILVHGGAAGADQLLAQTAQQHGIATEGHPAEWGVHTSRCPAWHHGLDVCKLAGHRRNDAMIAAGAEACLAFPTHGYHLAEGEDRARTSRGTWDCAEKAMKAGIPTLVVWGKDLYPFGDLGAEVLRRRAVERDLTLGGAGQLPILETWLPF
ncbi:SLOG family protein [Leifsonia sp. NPDC058194]|uniref:SLOG family protein n=1 Tax=Leifsonia sp. NPDC058194 TaxID=3346374 RepID=UPI0036D79163